MPPIPPPKSEIAAAQPGAPAVGAGSPRPNVPFGVNEIRLNARQWLAAIVLLGLVVLLTPWLWERLERFATGPDYRIPYDLSKDYWLYGRRVRQTAGPGHILRLAQERDVSRAEASAIMEEARAAVDRWPDFAGLAGVPDAKAGEIAGNI